MKNRETGLPLYEYYHNAIHVSGYTPIYSMILVLSGVATGVAIGATGLYYIVMLFGGSLSPSAAAGITLIYAFITDFLTSAEYYKKVPE